VEDREGARRGADSVRGYRPATARPAGTSLAVGEPLIIRGRLRFRQRPDRLRYRSRARVPAAITRRPTGTVRAASPSGAPLVISPLVRKLAKDNGIDVARLTPTGSHGVLLRRDVEQALTPAEDVTRIH